MYQTSSGAVQPRGRRTEAGACSSDGGASSGRAGPAPVSQVEEEGTRQRPDRAGSPRKFLETVGGFGVSPERARVILSLGGPVMIGMLTQTAVNLVDTAMVGRLPGSVSIPGQAALGLSLPIYWALGGFLSCIQIGTQAMVARRYGEGSKKLAGRALTNSLLLGVASAIVLSVVAILAVPLIFPFFHSDPEVIRWGVPYLQVRLVATIGMVATMSTKGFFDAIGRTHVHMVAAVVMNVLNVFGNWVLIFGKLGAPQMMVTGAAVASAGATFVGLVVILAWALGPRVQAEYDPFNLENRSGEVMRGIVRISWPSGVANVAVMTGFLLFMKIGAGLDADAGHGAIYTAATKVVIDIMSLTFMTCIAFGTATATLVGQSLGRKNPRRAELYGWESVKLASYFFAGIGIFTFLFPELFLGVFSKDPEVIAAGRPVLRLMACVQGFIAASLILVQANFGAGNTRFVMKVELFLHFLCLVPLAYVMGVVAGLGLFGMWLAVVTYIVLLVLVMGYKFYEGRWKETRV